MSGTTRAFDDAEERMLDRFDDEYDSCVGRYDRQLAEEAEVDALFSAAEEEAVRQAERDCGEEYADALDHGEGGGDPDEGWS